MEIIEAESGSDHIHTPVQIPPKIAVSCFVGYWKGKSSLIIFERHADGKYPYRNRKCWSRGYFVDTAGENTKKRAEFIQNQPKEDPLAEQLTRKE